MCRIERFPPLLLISQFFVFSAVILLSFDVFVLVCVVGVFGPVSTDNILCCCLLSTCSLTNHALPFCLCFVFWLCRALCCFLHCWLICLIRHSSLLVPFCCACHKFFCKCFIALLVCLFVLCSCIQGNHSFCLVTCVRFSLCVCVCVIVVQLWFWTLLFIWLWESLCVHISVCFFLRSWVGMRLPGCRLHVCNVVLS